MLRTIDYDRSDETLAVELPYFPTNAPTRYDDGTTYADDRVRLNNSTTFEWQHSLSEILQSLLSAGLTLTSFGEHRTIPWQALPRLIRTENGWSLPDGGERLPLTFSLTATKM